jgi:hypothetical protein
MTLLKKENRQSDAGLVQAMAQKCSKQLKQ